jgi:hypothetical protein
VITAPGYVLTPPCQIGVRGVAHDVHMPAQPENVIHQLAVGDRAAIAHIVLQAQTSNDVTTLVAAAFFAPDGSDLLTRAATLAVTTKDRQLVEIATAHLDGDADRVEDLARDHLADHPGSVLVAWITATSNATDTRRDPS